MDRMQIADYLAKKMFNRELEHGYNVMLKNKQIYYVADYGELIKSNKISPEDAFVYFSFIVHNEAESYKVPVKYLFPLIDRDSIYEIVDSYLSKLGFYGTDYPIYPATGLKYYGAVRLFSDRLVIELTDFDTIATNTRLRMIVMDVIGKDILTQKEINSEQIRKIDRKFYNQKLFARHNLKEVYEIIKNHYIRHNASLVKEVLDITNAYDQIFQPYRVVYDNVTQQ